MEFLKNDWGMALGFVTVIFLFLGSAEILLKRLNVHPNTTRRIVHILVGILVSFSPFLFSSVIPVITIALLFTAINYLAMFKSKFDGIHSTERRSYGTVYFPISFAILSIWFWDKDPAILITAMYIMTFGDPIAGWVGEYSKNRRVYTLWFDEKSFQGTFAMFIISYITVFVSILMYRTLFASTPSLSYLALTSFFVAIFAAVAESVSREGSDNLSVPLGSAFIMDILFNGSSALQNQLMFWIVITTATAWLVYKMRLLSLSGAVGAWILGSIIFGIGGLMWALPLIFFFVSSSLFSKMGQKHKHILHDIYEKSDRRDIFQVFANGGVGLVSTLIFYFTGNILWYYVYLASLAAATADTWATELGVFSPWNPRSIINFSEVLPGSSGGISPYGLLGAFAGSFLLSLLGLMSMRPHLIQLIDFNLALILLTQSGFVASLIDSLAGATIQAQYRCPSCKKITEKQTHCSDQVCILVRGNTKINNDIVNTLCTFSGLCLFLLLFILFS